MLAWRRRNEGFEWRKYVRTTVLVRRKERRRRIEDAKEAAVVGVKQAGRRGADAAVAGANSLGRGLGTFSSWLLDASGRLARWSGAALVALAAGLVAAIGGALSWLSRALGPPLSRATSRVAISLEPAVDALRRPEISLPLTLIACITALAATFRIAGHGLDEQALLAGAIALVTGLLTLGPRLAVGVRGPLTSTLVDWLERAGDQIVLLPGFDRLRPVQASALALLLIGGVAGASLWLATRSTHSAPSFASIPLLTSPKLEGRATGVTGDSLRLSGSIVKLADIEAPESDQSCSKPGVKHWRCGTAAKDALGRMIRGRRVTCELTGSETPAGRIGRCTVGGTDIAAELVRHGHVFATSGLFARYASLENDAKSAKSGLWAGEAERPADYRAKRWEEAKRSAPDGCPIKGQVASGARVYVLPWSPAYERIKVRGTRGERWFCSEAEALAAGWRPPAPS